MVEKARLAAEEKAAQLELKVNRMIDEEAMVEALLRQLEEEAFGQQHVVDEEASYEERLHQLPEHHGYNGRSVPQSDLLHEERPGHEHSDDDGRLIGHLQSQETPAVNVESHSDAVWRQQNRDLLASARNSDAKARLDSLHSDQNECEEDMMDYSYSGPEPHAHTEQE